MVADDNEILRHKMRAFLAAYAECGNITKAAESTGIARQTHYDWLRDDPEYPTLFKEADEQAGDRLEQEARRRAVEGVSEPVFYQGKQCGTIQRYSDTLLMFLLKGVRPDKYRENIKQEVSGPGGTPLNVVFNIPRPPKDEVDGC